VELHVVRFGRWYRVRRATAIIVVLLAVGLVPLWYVALVAGSASGSVSLGTGAAPVAVNASAHSFAPTSGFVGGLVEVGTTQAGVVTWIALLVLVGGLVAAFRFIDHLGGRGDVDRRRSSAPITVPSFFVRENRRVLEYVRPPSTRVGLLAIGGLAWAAFTLTSLLVYEGVTLARTQFLGLYLGGLFVVLALLVMTYAAYFVPHVTVVETREHAVEGDS